MVRMCVCACACMHVLVNNGAESKICICCFYFLNLFVKRGLYVLWILWYVCKNKLVAVDLKQKERRKKGRRGWTMVE